MPDRNDRTADPARPTGEAASAPAGLVDLVSSLPDGVVVMDRESVVRWVNPAAERLLGRSLSEIRGREFGHPPVTGEAVDIQLVGAGGTVRFAEMRVVETLWEGDDCLLASLRDTTARHLVEDELRRSEGLYRAVMDHSLQGIVVVQDGRVVFANRLSAVITGLSSEDLLSTTLVELLAMLDEEDGRRLAEVLSENASSHPPLGRTVTALSRDDGGRRWIELQPFVFDFEGTTIVQLSFIDVTERIETQNALARSEEQLRQSQKMEAVGRLAGGVAHDFNNLLTIIQGNIELLAASLDEGDPAREDADEIRRAARRSAHLTQQLLAFSRKQVRRPSVLDLREVVGGMHKMLQRLIGEDVLVDVHLPAALSTVRADTSQIEQVVMNLAVNARDAMPLGGELRITLCDEDLTDDLLDSVEAHPGRYVRMRVQDTGTGMDEETLGKIFEPFYTTKAQGEGSGLGLSTVYGIVRQNGGFVTVESAPGRGTCFDVHLPAASEPASQGTADGHAAIEGGSECILLVEDEEMVRTLASRILSRHGYRVVTASCGEEALGLCGDEAPDFQLLLTDVVMPGMDGQELWNRLSALRPGLKVLFMSGYTDEHIARHGVIDESTCFIEKPFTPEGLLAGVRAALE